MGELNSLDGLELPYEKMSSHLLGGALKIAQANPLVRRYERFEEKLGPKDPSRRAYPEPCMMSPIRDCASLCPVIGPLMVPIMNLN